jgi:hypothetical protein
MNENTNDGNVTDVQIDPLYFCRYFDIQLGNIFNENHRPPLAFEADI